MVAATRDKDTALKVLLVDDHPVVRNGLMLTLADEPDIDVVGAAASADEALQAVAQQRPDVVIMDIRLPGRSGLDAARELHERYPELKIVMLTVHGERIYLSRALQDGAVGFVLKDAPGEMIVEAIRAAGLGGSLTPTHLLRELITQKSHRPHPEGPTLTARESGVMKLLSEGYSNREIADQMSLAEGTVKKHVQSLMMKLDARSRAHAAARAVRLGLVD
ncbi:MAG: response regulator transcription factor [Candidatus Eremiobacteraeota bacterium]|nr:response regulator transcription factor [Candidatus Eremiobacteraeota bacterium]